MFRFILATVLVLGLAGAAIADTVVLKDGTTVEGSVIKFGKEYRVKTADGKTITVREIDVKQIIRGSTTSPPPAVAGSAPPPAPAPALKPGAQGLTSAFSAAKAKAERVEVPLAAIGLWQAYIDNNPTSPDLESAKAELARWKQLSKDNAEKVNGKWIGGEERKKLLKKVEETLEEAIKAEEGNTIKAIQKYEEAVKLYPNSFEAHFRLGYFYLVKGGNKKYDQAIKSLEQSVRVQPRSPEALTNLAVAYSFRDRHEQAVLTAYKAVQVEDSKELVENLLACFSYAPVGLQRNNARVRPIMEEARVLASKYGISGAVNGFHYLPPGYSDAKKRAEGKGGRGGGGDDDDGAAGVIGTGTGFFVSDDGYIMTNRHVAEPGDLLMVRFADGTEKPAERIVIDDEQDIALIKVKVDDKVPYVRLAEYDHPNIGTDVTALGFPLGSILGQTVKITRGIVTAWEKDQDQCDVIVDAQVNPGNSGGPMIDKHGNLLALVAMKTFSLDATTGASVSSYGLGISNGRIRKFLEKHQGKYTCKIEPAAASGTTLSSEEIASKLSPAVVCIVMIRDSSAAAGSPADGGKSAPEGAKP